ncbi:MAG: hypothetical protein KGJ53_10975 [Alphaproteobacteria bacterium]|nr:hypothetical protein [Alphaproteobacteria bacterium]
MTDKIMAIQNGRLSLSRITYHTDLQQASGLIIPLGVIAEMTLGTWRALGLIARTTLSIDEANALGRMIRERLTSPFEFLKQEFDWAFAETESGEALGALANRFSESLSFATPTSRVVKKVLPTGPSAADAILSELRKARDDEFYLMLAEYEDGKSGIACEDTTRLAA